MIHCQITKDGKIEEDVKQEGLLFQDNHGIELSNHICSPTLESSLKEWHYKDFGIMNQHYHGKEDHTSLIVMHDVQPAMMFSLATNGMGTKNVYEGKKLFKEVSWSPGIANLCFLSGEGGVKVNLNQDSRLDIFSIVIPQQAIASLVARNPEVLDSLLPLVNPHCDAHVIFKDNRLVEASVIKASKDIQRSRLLGNYAYKYIASKIIDCLSGFLSPKSLLSSKAYINTILRNKIYDAKEIILSRYQDMPSLHELAMMVGTNECTLKKVFKQEFGTTVFQYLYDYRMKLAAHYLLDTTWPIHIIGIRLGYDYQSHFCTAFKRKYGVSPIEFRQRRGGI